MERQLPLLVDIERAEKPWKVVRRVSKQLYAVLREGGYLKRSGLRVLTALAYYRNRTMTWPTPAELAQFMYDHKRRIPHPDCRYVAPRLTELVNGMVVRRHGQKVRVGGGVCDLLPRRVCRQTGQKAHPVAIREAGSKERTAA